MVGEYRDGSITICLSEQRLRVYQFHKSDGSELVPFPGQAELLFRQYAVSLFEFSALERGTNVGQADREISLKTQFLFADLLSDVVSLQSGSLEIPLAGEPLEDRDADPEREARRGLVEIERESIVSVLDRLPLRVGEGKAGTILPRKWVR